MMQELSLRPAAALLAASLAVAGCGGGGGGPAASALEPRPPPPVPVQPGPDRQDPPPAAVPPAPDPLPESQWSTRAVGLDAALGNLARAGVAGAPGEGVTVGFVDDGFEHDHPAFDPARVPQASIPGPSHNPFHATRVVGVVAAVPENVVPGYEWAPLRGVAWGADVRVVDRDFETAPDLSVPVRSLVRRDDPDIVSLSLSGDTLATDWTAADAQEHGEATVAALTPAGADPASRPILVVAAGNDHGKRCDPRDHILSGACRPSAAGGAAGTLDASTVSSLAGLPRFFPGLRGRAVAAVGTGPDGVIGGTSNRCGSAAGWCIAAPAYGVRVPNGGHTVATGGGTSLAAPMVAGGLAVMKQLFRSQLSNTELVARLFATADKGGIYADAATYGQGFMDLGAATAPVGEPAVPGGAAADGPGVAVAATSIRAGAAFGDGVARALAGRELAAFDDLGAPFWRRLGDLAAPAAAHRPRNPALRPDGPPPPAGSTRPGAPRPGSGAPRLGFSVTRPGAGGHAALAPGAAAASLALAPGAAAAAFTTSGRGGRADVSGATVSWAPPGSGPALRAGWIGERGTLAGTSATGAFGGLAADSVFVGAAAPRVSAAGWSLSAEAELGRVTPRAGGGLVAAVSPLTTSAASASARRRLAGGDRVTLRVSQPLRVEAGGARFTVPVGRTPEGAVLRSSFAAGLEPSGRQIDVSAEWRRPLAGTAGVAAAATWTRHPGHAAGRGPGLGLFLGLTAEF